MANGEHYDIIDLELLSHSVSTAAFPRSGRWLFYAKENLYYADENKYRQSQGESSLALPQSILKNGINKHILSRQLINGVGLSPAIRT